MDGLRQCRSSVLSEDRAQSTGHHVTTDGLEPATFGVLAKHQLNVPMSHVIRIILKDCPFLSYKIGKRNR